jgi:hypothetical protein
MRISLRYWYCFALVLGLLLLLGCNKIAEKAQEKAMEKLVETASDEEVDIDFDDHSMTIKDKETGATAEFTADEEGGKWETTDPGGGKGVVSVGEDAEIPEDWPESLPQYPGSTLEMSQRYESDGELFMSLTLYSKDPGSMIFRFYDEKAVNGGFTRVMQHQSSGLGSARYVSDEWNFSLTYAPEEGRTRFALQADSDVVDSSDSDSEVENGNADGQSAEGDESDASGSITSASGELPEGFPADILKPYPDAEIVQAMISDDGSMLLQRTTDPMSDVAAFYRTHFGRLGMTETKSMESEDTHLLAFENEEHVVGLQIASADDVVQMMLSLAKHEGAVAEDSLAITSGKLPDGFPTDILPIYPRGEVDRGALNGREATLLQRSDDNIDTIIKFYTKHFSSNGWETQAKIEAMGRTMLGFTKGSEKVDMMLMVEEEKRTFFSLAYTP